MQRNIPRLMIAATSSGGGKTTITCGLLQAFINRGIETISFKCGPDYIDPMFHTEVLGLKSRNLDLFFTDAQTTKNLFCKNAKGFELAVIEGVMGYYDGLAGISTEASSYDLARTMQTPVILLIDCKGKSVSILAEIKGFLELCPDSNIKGVLLNRCNAMLYPDLKKQIEKELEIEVYGYVPQRNDISLESRHLGLVTAKEIGNLKQILNRIAEQMEATVDLDRLLVLANSVKPIVCEVKECVPGNWRIDELSHVQEDKARIGVAMDQAFCFYYQDNLDLLAELGAEIVPFSPLKEETLPENLHGLIFGGGYPELYLETLSSNKNLLKEIKETISNGIPCLAECGGFMYLHEWIQDEEGKRVPMVGTIEGGSYPTEKLGRFGYITLTANQDNLLCKKGKSIRGHEFHYWDSTNTGDCFHAQKPLRKTEWNCMIAEGNLIAGYPHLHYYSNPHFAHNYIKSCMKYKKEVECIAKR
ncbi:cobyrinate a,c-diamide synthase [Sinanaerobacter sp. ZZT-01]|uniref:cobyrinate a,c-diamide synthase n=1 Tax=Sinanaerobacter sp. ZZT-01 TaxID=3111540 RepID=UPI002D774303|nr:cobyrinate a,c-diamide synthase [Sinanaerobacter sp. ZZT-01]WRR94680.1 cobyrinate a,c-diamide synthase [Sinanaerobacter sp. ZZT-01]